MSLKHTDAILGSAPPTQAERGCVIVTQAPLILRSCRRAPRHPGRDRRNRYSIGDGAPWQHCKTDSLPCIWHAIP